jgi:hypothetical protein
MTETADGEAQHEAGRPRQRRRTPAAAAAAAQREEEAWPGDGDGLGFLQRLSLGPAAGPEARPAGDRRKKRARSALAGAAAEEERRLAGPKTMQPLAVAAVSALSVYYGLKGVLGVRSWGPAAAAHALLLGPQLLGFCRSTAASGTPTCPRTPAPTVAARPLPPPPARPRATSSSAAATCGTCSAPSPLRWRPSAPPTGSTLAPCWARTARAT